MDKKKMILLVGALVIAIGTAWLAKTMFSDATASQAKATEAPAIIGPKVLVASRSLPVGTIITPDSFSFQPWPADLVEKAYYVSGETDQSLLIGTVVRYPITAGQPLTQGAIVHPGDRGFLAAALGPGMRAVTVPVSARTGVAGFVFPGDRVDLVLTQSVAGDDGPPLKASETIIRNLRVLATDQRVNALDEQNKSVVQTFSTVTVEATPKLAEKIAVAQTIGTLSLSLRSIADNEAELERAIASGDIEMPDTDDPDAEEKFLRTLASRPVDTDSSYSTGADVSRFQRRSMPRTNSAPRSAPTPSPAPVFIETPARGASVAPRAYGPSVRVSRGKDVTVVPVGGN